MDLLEKVVRNFWILLIDINKGLAKGNVKGSKLHTLSDCYESSDKKFFSSYKFFLTTIFKRKLKRTKRISSIKPPTHLVILYFRI